jgi:hypothetical protein
MTAMVGFITLGIFIYLILSCIQDGLDKSNSKRVEVEDTEIHYEVKENDDEKEEMEDLGNGTGRGMGNPGSKMAGYDTYRPIKNDMSNQYDEKGKFETIDSSAFDLRYLSKRNVSNTL